MGLIIKGNEAERKNLYEQIADSLETSILECQEESVKLPTENELAIKFGVSRAVIRESLNILRERGLIVTKVGEGTYTEKPNKEFLYKVFERLIKVNNVSDSDVNAIRLILECGGARLAAERLTPELISSLEDNLERMKNASDNLEERVNIDIEFHDLIAKQSGNDLLVIFIESINGLVLDYITRRLRQRPDGHSDGIMWHSKLIDLFKNGNPSEVESGMRQHLLDSFHQI